MMRFLQNKTLQSAGSLVLYERRWPKKWYVLSEREWKLGRRNPTCLPRSINVSDQMIHLCWIRRLIDLIDLVWENKWREGEFDLISRRAHSKLRHKYNIYWVGFNVLSFVLGKMFFWRLMQNIIEQNKGRNCTIVMPSVLVNNFRDIWWLLKESLWEIVF